jgi:tetratricopeptide (TPR) repeat protein
LKNLNLFSLLALILIFRTIPGSASEFNYFEYNAKPAFKAIASPPLANGVIDPEKLGFAWEYDTAQEAVDAAIAYCQENSGWKNDRGLCKIIRLGSTTVQFQTELPMLLKTYEKMELDRLEKELAQTGKRDIITRLSTIYQKIGRYKESEALLYDLAMSGEHLAQNALAYHWAELKIRLDHALRLVNAAIKQDPDFFSYRDTKGLVLTRLNRLDEAEASARRAVQLEAHPIALDHLGDILWLRGKKREAKQRWHMAAEASQNILFRKRVASKVKTGMVEDIVFE